MQKKIKVNHLGLTIEEQKVMDRLMETYRAFLDLPIQHPADTGEFGYAVHLIQGLLSCRIARREFPKGWPTYSIETPNEALNLTGEKAPPAS